jgi:hypothetical protein
MRCIIFDIEKTPSAGATNTNGRLTHRTEQAVVRAGVYYKRPLLPHGGSGFFLIPRPGFIGERMTRGKALLCPNFIVFSSSHPRFSSVDEAWMVIGPIYARILAQVINRSVPTPRPRVKKNQSNNS